jgi:hypothetical protein
MNKEQFDDTYAGITLESVAWALRHFRDTGKNWLQGVKRGSDDHFHRSASMTGLISLLEKISKRGNKTFTALKESQKESGNYDNVRGNILKFVNEYGFRL